MKKSLDEIAETEKEYWNENKLERSKIKKLRRHAFYHSNKRQKRILNELVKTFDNKELLEIGSHFWVNLLKNKSTPKKISCINISEVELQKGIDANNNPKMNIDFQLMDGNNLTFEDESFDVVYGGAILHHLDVDRSVGHIHRVLKQNGYILFTEPLNINPLYKLYRKLNPKERTPDEHALVSSDMRILRDNFTFEHYFTDFASVIFGFIALKVFGDKNYDNWINKLGYKIDVFISKLPFSHFLFARMIIFGRKK